MGGIKLKKCEYCGSIFRDDVNSCLNCNAKQFTKICPNCGQEIKDGDFCKFCGTKADSVSKICPKCGSEYFSKACPDCGYIPGDWRQNPVNVTNNYYQTHNTTVSGNNKYGKKCSKWVAFILCLFFGFFGVHKFYERKIGMGILYIFTIGLCGIGWLIDIFVILFKPNPYYV